MFVPQRAQKYVLWDKDTRENEASSGVPAVFTVAEDGVRQRCGFFGARSERSL